MSRIQHALRRAESHRVAEPRDEWAQGGEHACPSVSQDDAATETRELQGSSSGRQTPKAPPLEAGEDLIAQRASLVEHACQTLSEEVSQHVHQLSTQVEGRVSELCDELLTEFRRLDQARGETPPQPSDGFNHRQQEAQPANESSPRQGMELPAHRGPSAAQLPPDQEAQLQKLEEHLQERVSLLTGRMEQRVADLEQRSQEWNKHAAQQEVRLQLLRDKSNLQSGQLQEKLEQQLQLLENKIHDMLVGASGQLKGRLQYALENSLAPLEERAQQAERRIETIASRGVRQLNDILAGAEGRLQRAWIEAGQTFRTQCEANWAESLGIFERAAQNVFQVCRNKGNGHVNEVFVSMAEILRLYADGISRSVSTVCEQLAVRRNGEEAQHKDPRGDFAPGRETTRRNLDRSAPVKTQAMGNRP